jgi:hypothetical protein
MTETPGGDVDTNTYVRNKMLSLQDGPLAPNATSRLVSPYSVEVSKMDDDGDEWGSTVSNMSPRNLLQYMSLWVSNNAAVNLI